MEIVLNHIKSDILLITNQNLVDKNWLGFFLKKNIYFILM
jgi:hypothetical protein